MLELMHQVLMTLLCTAELKTAKVGLDDIAKFLTNTAWVSHLTYHTILKASLDVEIFGQDTLFDIPFLADLTSIREHRQHQTDCNTAR